MEQNTTLQTPLGAWTEDFPYMQAGTGFLIGLSIGYVLKKSFKILLFVTGVMLIGAFVLESQGLIAIDEAMLEQEVGGWFERFKQIAWMLKERVAKLELSGSISAVAGFFVGLKIG